MCERERAGGGEKWLIENNKDQGSEVSQMEASIVFLSCESAVYTRAGNLAVVLGAGKIRRPGAVFA